MVGAQGANSANLTATINFIAKLDQNSFNGIKKQLQSVGGGNASGGGDDSGGPPANRQSGGGGNKLAQAAMMKGGPGGAAAGGMAGGGAMMAVGAIMKGVQSIFEILQKIFQILMDSSPLFQAVGKLFQTSMKLLFMPLGNMIAKVLMPIMLKYLQKSAERASKYANAPPSSMEEVTSGTMTDMIGALSEVFGKIMTDVMPPLIVGIGAGIIAGIGRLFGGGGDVEGAVRNSLKSSTDAYDKMFSASGMKLVSGATGFMSALDRFGLTMYTNNNTLGKAASDMATVFYTGANTIENGFDKTSTVLVYGTTSMLKDINDKYHLMAAGVVTAFDTVIGRAQTFGQNLADISGGLINEFVSLKQPIRNVLEDLVNLGQGFNILAQAIPVILMMMLDKLRDATLEGNGMSKTAAAIKFSGKYQNITDTFNKNGSGKATILNSDEAMSKLGYDSGGLDVAVWKSNGAYVISNVDTGEVLKEGWYDIASAQATINGSAYTYGEMVAGGLINIFSGGTMGLAYAQSEANTANEAVARKMANFSAQSASTQITVQGDVYGLDELKALLEKYSNTQAARSYRGGN